MNTTKPAAPINLSDENRQIFILKSRNSELKSLVGALKTENLRLQKKVASMEANNISANNRIKVLQQIARNQNITPQETDVSAMSDDELQAELARLQMAITKNSVA